MKSNNKNNNEKHYSSVGFKLGAIRSSNLSKSAISIVELNLKILVIPFTKSNKIDK